MPSPPTPRTTAELVGGIIQVQTDFDITPFIMTANLLVTDVCTYPQVDGDQSLIPYSDGYVGSKMELLERWLAAHFYTIYDNQLAAAKAGTVSVSYQFKTDLGLKASMYGQQVLRMDTYGGLAKLDNMVEKARKITVSVSWGGNCDPCVSSCHCE